MAKGSRGGKRSSGGRKRTSNVFSSSKEVEIETYYRRKGRYYGKNVFEATSDRNGVVDLGRPNWDYESSGANTITVKAKMKAGIVNDNDFGINWDNVKVVKGDTFESRGLIKGLGFKWNPKEKQWEK